MTDADLELSIAEAEVAFLEELVGRGVIPAGDYRLPTTAELRSGVRFAQLAAIVDDAAARLALIAVESRDVTLGLLDDDLADLEPAEILTRLSRLAYAVDDATLDGLRPILSDAADRAMGILYEAYDDGALEALEEAVRQGVPVEDLVVRRMVDTPDDLYGRVSARADDVAYTASRQAITVAREAALNAAAGLAADDLRTVVFDAVLSSSTKGVEDRARQAASMAHDSGRTAGLDSVTRGPGVAPSASTGDRQPAEIYASELLDGNTCEPCARVDERQYDTLDEALEDYPGFGGYVGCLGGARCRGTVVVVWDAEAAPTLEQPGYGARGQAPDRSKRGPSGVARPDHIAEDGTVIVRPST